MDHVDEFAAFILDEFHDFADVFLGAKHLEFDPGFVDGFHLREIQVGGVVDYFTIYQVFN